jgi:MFS family permease
MRALLCQRFMAYLRQFLLTEDGIVTQNLKKNYRLYLTAEVVLSLASGIFGPFFVLFIAKKGGGLENLGFAIGITVLADAVVTFFVGKYSDRFGRKPFLIFQGFARVIITLSYLLIASVWQLFLIQLLSGLVNGLTTVESSFLADITEGSRRGEHIGRFHAITGAAAGIALMAGGFFAKIFGIEFMFALMASAQLFATICMLLTSETTSPAKGY